MLRRSFLQVGSIAGINLSLANYLKLQADDKIEKPKANSVIYIYLPGGFAAQETFDPKPLAPLEYRGSLKHINTVLPAVKFSEHLKETAKIADKINVIRSMTHGETAHERGTNNMFTGWRPSPALQYPSMGSVVSHELGVRDNLPPYVTVPNVPNEFAGSGYLSKSHSSFSLGSNPEDPNFRVRDLKLPGNVGIERFEHRKKILEIVTKRFNSTQNSDQVTAMDTFYSNAFEMLNSKQATEAFDLNKENEKTKEAYGKNSAGMRLLLSRRLIEAGVRFVTVTYGGWDMHQNIATSIGNSPPSFDKAFSALIKDLDQRGLLESTLVCISTEFGRTPKINKDAGRDHWPKVFSTVMAGGGTKQGIVHGSSDSTNTDVLDNPVTPENWGATIFNLLGIDYTKNLMAPGDRPVKIIGEGGEPIKEIIS